MGLNEDWLTVGASLKWPLDELQLLALLYGLHFSSLEVVAWFELATPFEISVNKGSKVQITEASWFWLLVPFQGSAGICNRHQCSRPWPHVVSAALSEPSLPALQDFHIQTSDKISPVSTWVKQEHSRTLTFIWSPIWGQTEQKHYCGLI